MYARLRPNRSPILLPIRMNAADTSASSATAAWTALAVVSRSRTTAGMDTFISEVSMTKTNMAIASSTPRRGVPDADGDDTPRSIPETADAVSSRNRRGPDRAHWSRFAEEEEIVIGTLTRSVGVAAVAVLAGAGSAHATTKWLCGPGVGNDPCRPSLSTTLYRGWRRPAGKPTPKRDPH